MTVENKIRAFAGIFILVSLVLYLYVSPYWLFFTAFVGANLLQSAFTGFCPLEIILKRCGKNGGSCCCGGTPSGK
jgi:hypothetical protein